MNKTIKFTGTYKGINFLISLHGIDESRNPEGSWCYYILINEKQIPDEYKEDFILVPKFDDKGRLSHDYYSTDVANLDWHGGITYYSKEGGADGEPIICKFGCDYSHYCDKGNSYSEDVLLFDVKELINQLWEKYPLLKVRSYFYGGYFTASEGEFNATGDFVAKKEKEQWAIDYPKTTIEGV